MYFVFFICCILCVGPVRGVWPFPIDLYSLIKLRMEMGNVSKRQQPDHRIDNSRRSPIRFVFYVVLLRHCLWLVEAVNSYKHAKYVCLLVYKIKIIWFCHLIRDFPFWIFLWVQYFCDLTFYMFGDISFWSS